MCVFYKTARSKERRIARRRNVKEDGKERMKRIRSEEAARRVDAIWKNVEADG